MKRLAVLLILVLLFSSISVAALASDKYDLSNYGYRRVESKGRGSLIFQKSPRGSFMKNHKFYDGDQIYVNLNWREDGYAMAYEGGEYGYVDASYINWGNGGSKNSGSSKSSSSSSGGSGNVTFSGNVNVRTGPGLDYGQMGSMNKGQSLTYAGDTQYDNRGVAWYSVYYNGSKGWVSSKYASVKGGSSGNKSSSASNGSGQAYSSYSSSYYNPDGGFINHSIRSVSGDSNVRTGPGLGYASIGVLYKGEGATYCDHISYDNRGVAWYYVRFCGEYGWVSSRYTIID